VMSWLTTILYGNPMAGEAAVGKACNMDLPSNSSRQPMILRYSTLSRPLLVADVHSVHACNVRRLLVLLLISRGSLPKEIA